MLKSDFFFSGRSGLLTPVIYYQFLLLRLSSRRNAFTRNVFIEIANTIEQVSFLKSVSDLMRRMVPYQQ